VSQNAGLREAANAAAAIVVEAGTFWGTKIEGRGRFDRIIDENYIVV
jgi:hypothetical protein